MAEKKQDKHGKEMQGTVFAEVTCKSENNAFVYEKWSRGGKTHTSCENIPYDHYAGHQPKASLLRLDAEEHRMATRLPFF